MSVQPKTVMDFPDDEEYLLSTIKLSKDLKVAATRLQTKQVRYFVDRYYQFQHERTRADNQIKEAEVPNELLTFTRGHAWKLECLIKRTMGIYAESKEVGQWLIGNHGIGPVISAGLLAHLDITKAKSAGSFSRFAGLDPTVEWMGRANVAKLVTEEIKAHKKIEQAVAPLCLRLGRSADSVIYQATTKRDGTTRALNKDNLTKALCRQPWNARLKVLLWKLGDSMVKHRNHDKCFYGKLYAKRKKFEIEQNVSGAHVEECKRILADKNFSKETVARKAYESGIFPDGHVDMRARRQVEKLFLSHLFQVMYEVEYNRPAPIPWVFAFADHDFYHYLRPPNWDKFPDEAYKKPSGEWKGREEFEADNDPKKPKGKKPRKPKE